MNSEFFDNETSRGSSFVPNDAVAKRGGPPPTKVGASPPFLLVFDPSRWTMLNGRVVPNFKKMPLVSGVGGCTATRNRVTGEENAVRSGAARTDLAEANCIVIEAGMVPTHMLPPGAAQTYLWSPEGRPDVTLTIFERVFPGQDYVRPVMDKYLEWIEWLQVEGIIPTPPSHILTGLLERKVKDHVALARNADKDDFSRAAAQAAADDIAILRAEIRKREEANIPAAAGSGTVPNDPDAPASQPRRGK